MLYMEFGMTYVVGHRGAAAILPENTLKSFRYAIDLGVDFTECDVHLTWDDHLVVMHDEHVDRTTNGTGAIRRMTFEAIRSLDAGGGEQVPTFDEVLDTVQGKVKLLCELKGEGVEKAAVDAVIARKMEADVTFTSFWMDRIKKVKARREDLAIAAIFGNPSDDAIANAIEMGVGRIEINYRNLCLRMVRQVRDAGLDLTAWNPDTLEEQRAMIALGASGICSNRPDILVEYLKNEATDR
jgi:glycerophosphoryl diester phosphodiesterase